ncbi:hypothetical protein [Paenibacillus sp. Soil522]|uniref:hypothetical protein n=1 Tax=Paenibacillus sp. Soil522 TaxID=1736388 RepID=UPI0009D68D36
MTKKQVLIGIIIALTVAAAVDYGVFVVWGLIYVTGFKQPADFEYHNSDNTFVIFHYQFVWTHYLLEAVSIFGLILIGFIE